MAKVAEKRPRAAPLLALASLALCACAPEPRVSALWGGDPLIPPLSAYVEAPDLAGRLKTIDAETAELGLRMTLEARGKLPMAAGTVVVRAYEGTDAIGRKAHAVRAATPRGIIMAAGPRAYPEPMEAGARAATELIPALIPDDRGGTGGAFQAATDINGDGYPDVVLRNDEGQMEIWRLGPTGAGRYEVRMESPPSSALDADGDGSIDFAGAVRPARGDLIAPELLDFAVWSGTGYTNSAPGARAAHAQRVKALEALIKGRPAGDKLDERAAPPSPISDEVRLRRALSLAWHAILSGRSREEALKKLDGEPVPAPLRAELDRHRSRIEQIGKGRP